MNVSDAPISAWLHVGPSSLAHVRVSFIGTHQQLSLTPEQVRTLRRQLQEAEAILEGDNGDLLTRTSHKLQGID